MSNYVLTKKGELKHYGIPGMKWGKRKARPVVSLDGSKKRAYDTARKQFEQARIQKKTANSAYNKAFNEGSKIRNMFGERGKAHTNEIVRTAEQANASDKQYKTAKKAMKVAKKAAKIEAKAVKKEYRKEYMKGLSTAGKIWAKYTDGDRIYADLAYSQNKGAYKKAR